MFEGVTTIMPRPSSTIFRRSMKNSKIQRRSYFIVKVQAAEVLDARDGTPFFIAIRYSILALIFK